MISQSCRVRLNVLEGGLEEWNVYNQDQQDQVKQDGQVQPAVAERLVQDRMPVGAEVVGLEKLDQHQRDKSHRHRFLQAAPGIDCPGKQPQVDQRGPDPARHHQDDHRPGKNARARVARLAPHQILLGRVHRQRQSGQTIGSQVDVQDLHRGQTAAAARAAQTRPSARFRRCWRRAGTSGIS